MEQSKSNNIRDRFQHIMDQLYLYGPVGEYSSGNEYELLLTDLKFLVEELLRNDHHLTE